MAGKPKGSPKSGGRIAGTPNKTTKTVKETFQAVFHKLQEHPKANLLKWAESQPSEFYRIATKLIPTTLAAELDGEGKDGKSFEITLKI
jgi:hypothetical protein